MMFWKSLSEISVLMKMFCNFKFTLELESSSFVYLLSQPKELSYLIRGDQNTTYTSFSFLLCGKQTWWNDLKHLFILWKQNQVKITKIIRLVIQISIHRLAKAHAIIIYRINNIYIWIRLSFAYHFSPSAIIISIII